MRKKIVAWIRRLVAEAGAKGIAMGLSGGIDSAVVAYLAREAVGKENVLALFLPCQSHKQDLRDAKLAARKIGIRTKTVDLTSSYESLIRILPQAGDMPRANLKPRLRAQVLYYFANKYNYLVCGTGNKSELMAGYFTKYGDGAVDLLPIGCLYKKQVRKLAAELGVPRVIIDKPPTAGLWPGQTDEGEMGITYAELDDILERLETGKRQILAQAKVNRVKSMIRRSAHKRRGPVICSV